MSYMYMNRKYSKIILQNDVITEMSSPLCGNAKSFSTEKHFPKTVNRFESVPVVNAGSDCWVWCWLYSHVYMLM